MITIFNGRSRSLGKNNPGHVFAQIDVDMRDHLHHFKGARWAVFTAICLHANEDGWAWPSIALLARETGYNPRTIITTLTDLCQLEIDGNRVLLAYQPKRDGARFDNNRYLIFPDEHEIQTYEVQNPRARKPRTSTDSSPSVENLHTEPSVEKITLTITSDSKQEPQDSLPRKMRERSRAADAEQNQLSMFGNSDLSTDNHPSSSQDSRTAASLLDGGSPTVDEESSAPVKNVTKPRNKREPKAPSLHAQFMKRFHELEGVIRNGGEAATGMKKLEQTGCTIEEFDALYHYVKSSEFWYVTYLKPIELASQYPNWVRMPGRSCTRSRICRRG